MLNLIGGELIGPVSDKWIDNINPALGEVYSLLPDSDERDIQLAVDAAKKAQKSWELCSIESRSRILLKIASLIEENLENLALAESIDNGKPVGLAKKVDIPRAAANFRFFASSVVGFASESHIIEGTAVNYTRRKSIGIVGCISPWNLPLYLFTWKIAPALATGNCVVAKPSELTPMTAFRLSEICIEAGLPPGVLNVIHGHGSKTGQAIVEHPEIKAISFTGGTQTGKKIISTAGPMFKKLSLELGGKNPTIVFEDCDYENTLNQVIRSSFSNQGEICLCGSRLLIQQSIYDRFVTDFVEKARRLKVGDPLSEVDMGALVSKDHLEKVEGYVKLAKEEKGEILTGGGRLTFDAHHAKGFFFQPTVIAGLSNSCRTNQEEIFGPVVSVMPFHDQQEALMLANDTTYGLSASIWTSNSKTAHQTAHGLDVGIIWVNSWLLRDLRTPFGGTKQSGLGREGGYEALRFFTEAQNICIDIQ